MNCYRCERESETRRKKWKKGGRVYYYIKLLFIFYQILIICLVLLVFCKYSNRTNVRRWWWRKAILTRRNQLLNYSFKFDLEKGWKCVSILYKSLSAATNVLKQKQTNEKTCSTRKNSHPHLLKIPNLIIIILQL